MIHSLYGLFSTSLTPAGTLLLTELTVSAKHFHMSNSFSAIWTAPASILERSSISLTSLKSNSLLLLIRLIYSFLLSLSSSSWSRPAKPTIALRGVLISWLIFARKEDLSLSASLAFSISTLSSCCTSTSVVLSRLNPTNLVTTPSFLTSSGLAVVVQ